MSKSGQELFWIPAFLLLLTLIWSLLTGRWPKKSEQQKHRTRSSSCNTWVVNAAHEKICVVDGVSPLVLQGVPTRFADERIPVLFDSHIEGEPQGYFLLVRGRRKGAVVIILLRGDERPQLIPNGSGQEAILRGRWIVEEGSGIFPEVALLLLEVPYGATISFATGTVQVHRNDLTVTDSVR